MLPKTFANETLDAITPYRGFNVFACYRQTQPRQRELVILPEYYKIFITGALRAGKHTLEIAALGKTLCAGKAPAG